MPLDASIILGGKQPQFENPLNMLAQAMQVQGLQSQNELARYSINKAQRSDSETNALAQLASSGVDFTTPEGQRKAYGVAPTVAPAYLKARIDQQKLQGEVTAQQSKLVDDKLKQSKEMLDGVTTPEQYLQWHQANHADPVLGPMLAARGVTPEQTQQTIQQALQTPGGFEQLLQKSALGLAKFTELNKPTVHVQNTGGASNLVATPGLGGAPTVLSSTPMTQSPDSVATNATTRRGQDLVDARMRDPAVTLKHGTLGLSEAQNEALFGESGAVTTGKLDPNRINSRTAGLLADAFIKNPNTNMAKLSADISLNRNATFRQRAMTAEVLPEIMNNMVDTGKKIGFSDVRTVGKMQAWVKGEMNDPDMTEYMSQRNDALMTIASVMRGNGMTDMAHKAETEVAAPTMNPAALDAWLKGQMKSLEPRLKINRSITGGPSGAPATSNPVTSAIDAELARRGGR